jgi:hypothetical protein
MPAPQRVGPPRELREALEGAAVITLTDGEQHGDVLPDPQALLRRADWSNPQKIPPTCSKNALFHRFTP